ncbi:DUF4167 domain-containing protein [Sphingomonas sabuli]|uniref:DUF4167 domain-containing protein n=1 Tax=Sphingomonas sabuli TaxID=2764186 RepID=A0A7G9KZZ0_9SPHN|nr:DUF4167 domain-containing protein [Sphingomonas sabuli]QNM81939.1 DUF4167 domain-containing protein [Sphingomonas sabuli]
MINNRQGGGRRRGRGGQRGPNLGGNRQDNRQRGNAAQLLEKYKNMARDAQLAGDRVQSEYFLQFADHYFRVLGESRSRYDDQRKARGDDSSDDEDNDNDNDGDSYDASDEDSGDRPSRNQRGNGSGRDRSDKPDRSRRNGSRNASSDDDDQDDDGERIAMTALPPAIGRDGDDGEEEAPAKPKRRATRKPRNDGDVDVAPAA